MIQRNRSKHIRVLGIVPSSRGFGYAVMEGNRTLVDWGSKRVKGDKNARCLSQVADLLALYVPDVIALEDAQDRGSRRGSRVQVLIKEIIAMASDDSIELKYFSRKQLSDGFFGGKTRTKHLLAEHLAVCFPGELGFRLPRKRRPWMTEDARMDIFDAVALADHVLRSGKMPTG